MTWRWRSLDQMATIAGCFWAMTSCVPALCAARCKEIKSGYDVYLTRHMEFLYDRKVWDIWPVLNFSDPTHFDLADPAQRAKYFAAAINTGLFSGFMGAMITKRPLWDRVPFNAKFDGSCWAHAARFFELMKTGLSLKYIPEAWQDRRPDNDDSFMGRVSSRVSHCRSMAIMKLPTHFSDTTASRRTMCVVSSEKNSASECS